MKSNTLILIIVSLLVLAAITNPGIEKHKEVVKSKINESLQANLSNSENSTEQAGEALGAAFGGVIIEKMVDNIVSSDSYVVCSTTKITWQGQSKVIGIGLFGNVFLSGQLDEAMKSGNGVFNN